MGARETRTFKSGNSEALRLPKGMGFGIGVDVRVERSGDALMIRAVDDPEDARRKLRQLVADLRAIGRAGEIEEREAIRIEFPDRPGLY